MMLVHSSATIRMKTVVKALPKVSKLSLGDVPAYAQSSRSASEQGTGLLSASNLI